MISAPTSRARERRTSGGIEVVDVLFEDHDERPPPSDVGRRTVYTSVTSMLVTRAGEVWHTSRHAS